MTGMEGTGPGGPGGPMVVTAPQAGSNTPGPKLNFTVNAQNLLNNTQNRGYYGVLGSPLFGTSHRDCGSEDLGNPIGIERCIGPRGNHASDVL